MLSVLCDAARGTYEGPSYKGGSKEGDTVTLKGRVVVAVAVVVVAVVVLLLVVMDVSMVVMVVVMGSGVLASGRSVGDGDSKGCGSELMVGGSNREGKRKEDNIELFATSKVVRVGDVEVDTLLLMVVVGTTTRSG
jgi:hypothetical protein